MLKLLILGLIIFVYYKFFLSPKRLNSRDQYKIERDRKEEEEYTDYEEIE